MPIEVNPSEENEQTVIWSFSGRWTWDEYYQVYENYKINVIGDEQQSHEPYYVVALFETNYIPTGGAIAHVSRTLKQSENHGLTMTYLVTDSSFVKRMLKMLHTLQPDFKNKYRPAESLQDAYQKINALRGNPN